MRILILGTSNSLRKGGWVAGLATTLPSAEIVNQSLGGAPSIQFALKMQTDFTQFDFVIFDALVNDQNLWSAVGRLSRLGMHLFEIMSTIARSSRLIVLGLPTLPHLENETNVQRLHRDTASLVGGQFVSVQRLVARHCRGPGDGRRLFNDPTHIHLDIAHALGRRLGTALHSLHFDPSPTCPSFADRYLSIEAALDPAFTHLPQKERVNSLLCRKFVELRSGDIVELQVRDAQLIGVEINVPATFGVLELDNRVTKRKLALFLGKAPDNFEARFVPIREGHDTNRMTLGKLDVEHTPHTLLAQFLRYAQHKIEISHLAFRRRGNELTEPTAVGTQYENDILERMIEDLLYRDISAHFA